MRNVNDDTSTKPVDYDLNEYQDVARPISSSSTAVLEPKETEETDMTEPTQSVEEVLEAQTESSEMMTNKNNSYVMEKSALDSEPHELDTTPEYPSNVKTLVRLVGDLPEGVTKQTGAQIIRLTMEAMGISMETVLSEAQATQSELLDAARINLKKIEEYRTIIRRLESEIRFQQNKANELSEIIDLFILSNTSAKMPNLDNLETE